MDENNYKNELDEHIPESYSLEDENIESDNPGADAGPKETKLKRGLDIFGCLFALNICFVISILPVFTIGAALTAMYAMMFRIQRHDDYTVVREYFMEFRQNFKKGTIAWLLIILAVVIMWGQYTYICNFSGPMVSLYEILLIVESVLVVLTIPFVFPLLAYFDNSIKNTFRNSFLLAVSNLGSWLKVFIAWVAVFFVSYKYTIVFLSTWYLWLLIIFGLLTYGSSLTAKKVFDKVKRTQEDNSKDDGSITIKEANERKKREKKARKNASKKSIKEHISTMDVVNGVIPKEDVKQQVDAK